MAKPLLLPLITWLNLGAVSQAILTNPDVRLGTPMRQMWQNDFWGVPLNSGNSHGSYRPLCVLSYRLNYLACGLRPWGYHLGNVLLHGLATSLVYRTGTVLGVSGSGAAALAFAAHPIHTEAVAGLVGRADLLSTIFFLLSFLTYTRHVSAREARAGCLYLPQQQHQQQQHQVGKKPLGGSGQEALVQWVYLWASLGLAACAMLCKETGVTVLAVSALYDILVHRHSLSLKLSCGALKSLCWLGAGLVVLLACRLHLMGLNTPSFAASDNPTARHPSLLARTLTFLFLPAFNAFLLVFPRWLSFDWSMEAIPRIASLFDPRNLFTILFYGLLYLCVSRCVRSLKREAEIIAKKPKLRKCKGCGQGCGYHNRYCKIANNNNYTVSSYASLTQCLCSKVLRPARFRRESEAILISMSILVIPFIPASNLFFYVGFVVAERILYLPSVGYCLLIGVGYGRISKLSLPRIGFTLLILTFATRTYLRNFDWMDEEALYRSGIPINPPKAFGNLGSVLSSQGRVEEAEAAFRIALKYRPNMADVYYNLGILLHGKGHHEEAIESYQKAVHYRPSLALAHLNLGMLLASEGRTREAERVLVRCSLLDGSKVRDPRTHEATRVSALVHLGRLYADRGQHEKAVQAYMQAVHIRPASYQPQVLYNLLGESLGRQGRQEEAERWFKAALSAKPDHVPAHLTYGKLLAKNKQKAVSPNSFFLEPRLLITYSGQRSHSRRLMNVTKLSLTTTEYMSTRISEAEQWFIRAKKLAPSDPTVYFHFGQFLSERSRHREAASQYRIAAELAPDQYESVVGAATALRQAGMHQEAERFYRRAVQLRPKEASSYSNLGAMLHLNGKAREAAAAYREALRLNPSDRTTASNLRKLHQLHPHL